MTWVIGTSSFTGYGVMISDVQVTFADGKTRDLLRKAYPIANHVVAGFAGSVRIGFVLLQTLADLLRIPPDQAQTHAWDPLWIANKWPPIARQAFANQPQSEQRLRASVLLVAISPTQDRGVPEFPKVYLIRFASPEFKPGIITRGFQACSIGSGGGVFKYKRTLKELCRMQSGIQKAEVGRLFGWADMLCFSLSRVAIDNPKPGISRHFNLLAFNRREMVDTNSDHSTHVGDDLVIETKMPPIASSYGEFLSMCGASNLQAATAFC